MPDIKVENSGSYAVSKLFLGQLEGEDKEYA